MKTIVLFLVLILSAASVFGACEPLTFLGPGSIPFEYDPNSTAYGIIAYKQLMVGETYEGVIAGCESTGESLIVEKAEGPENIILNTEPYQIDGERYYWRWSWTPDTTGVYYIAFSVIDNSQTNPPDLGATATIVFLVYEPDSNYPTIEYEDYTGPVAFRFMPFLHSWWLEG